jgi:acetyl-CoA C-acetyltransferase
MNSDDVVIVSAKRTPLGSMLGKLSSLTAPELGALANKAALKDANLSATDIQEIFTGCVLQAGIGQAPGRQAAIKAGIPESVGVSTINKMCGSGMKAVMLAHDIIKAGSADIVLAGGMESMSNAPYLLAKARAGYRLGHGELIDHMYKDGLEDAYDQGKLMGYFAENTATQFNISRDQQDEYARSSMNKALKAQKDSSFAAEIVPISVEMPKTSFIVEEDEGPNPEKLDKIGRLKPSFKTDGTITPANSSSVSDGAASLVIMSAKEAKKRGLKPLAKIIAHASHAQEPAWFTTAPIEAIRKVLNKAGWDKSQVDLFEINEAFAIVAMVAIEELGLDKEKVNIHGGACALGHPIGASGARILVTLIHALKKYNKKRGVAAVCIGGGEATAVAVEIINA